MFPSNILGIESKFKHIFICALLLPHNSVAHYIVNLLEKQLPDKKNPVTGSGCNEAFTNLKKQRGKIPDDFLVKFFYASLGVLGVYLLINIMKRVKERK